MSGFLKMVWMLTLPSWHFSQKIHRIFPSINHRQSVNTQPTHPPCLCLTGWLSTAKPAAHVWPRLTCKENRHFHWAKSHSLWPSPPSRGKCLGPPMVAAGSQAPGLSASTLLFKPPAFSSTAKACQPAIKSFASNSTLLKNPDILVGNAREMPPACRCQLKVFPMTGSALQQLNILAQYMSGVLKMVWMSTLPPWHFTQKIHRSFPSINHTLLWVYFVLLFISEKAKTCLVYDKTITGIRLGFCDLQN